MSAQEVLTHHLEAFGAGDLDGVMSDYSSDSTFYMPDGVLRGPEEIRPPFEKLLADVLPPGCQFEMRKQVVEGDLAYIVWSASSATVDVPMGTDTFIIRDGKILSQTFAALLIPKS